MCSYQVRIWCFWIKYLTCGMSMMIEQTMLIFRLTSCWTMQRELFHHFFRRWCWDMPSDWNCNVYLYAFRYWLCFFYLTFVLIHSGIYNHSLHLHLPTNNQSLYPFLKIESGKNVSLVYLSKWLYDIADLVLVITIFNLVSNGLSYLWWLCV